MSESQIEPWLAHRPQVLLVGVSSRRSGFDAVPMCPNFTSSTAQARRCQRPRPWPKGLNAANKLTLAAKGKNFLLTFPLIEPAPLLLRVRQVDLSPVTVFRTDTL